MDRTPNSEAPGEPPRAQRTTAPQQRDETRSPPRPGQWRYTFSSLQNRNFLYLWLGMLTMFCGMQMQMMVRIFLVYDITESSATLLGVVSAASALPMLGLSPFGGAIADRVDRKRIIQLGQAGAALIALLVGIAVTTDIINWYYLLAAGVLHGSVFAFMMPARQAIIPQLVRRDQITNAMALNAAVMSSMVLVAPPIAGVIYAFAGADVVYYTISGLVLVAMVLVGLIPSTEAQTTKARAPMLKEIVAGLSYIRGSPLVIVLILMGLITTLLVQPFRFLLPVFVVDLYHRGPDSMGLLLGLMGAGSLVGSLFVASLGKWMRGRLIIAGSLLSGIALLLLAVFPFYLAAAALMLLLGLGDAARRSLNQSLIMEQVDDQYRGRVMSIYMMNFGLMPLGVLPAGLIADAWGGQTAIGILAGLLLAITVVVLLTQKRLRQLS